MIIIIFIILSGVFFWTCNLGTLVFNRDWPLLLILIGLCAIFSIYKKSKRDRIVRNLEKGKINVEEAEEQLKKTRE